MREDRFGLFITTRNQFCYNIVKVGMSCFLNNYNIINGTWSNLMAWDTIIETHIRTQVPSQEKP